jgi:DNA-binding transcriptional LysR family regulator
MTAKAKIRYRKKGGSGMDFRELEYFTVIAQTCNLTRAAKQLYVSQPTLTKFLQRLEHSVGMPLFQRTGKQMTLTYAGQQYLHYAEQLLRLKQEMDASMEGLLRVERGILRVGMPPLRCSVTLPLVLPKFRQIYPNVEFYLAEESSESLDHSLLDGQIDLAFYNLSERKPYLCYELLAKDEVYAAVQKGHPVSKYAWHDKMSDAPLIRLENLCDETFILQNRNQRMGQYLLREINEKHITPRKILESSNIRAGLSLASDGYGVAFLNRGLLRHMEKDCPLDCYRLADCSTDIYFAAAWKEDIVLPRYAKEFIRLMRENA